LLNIENAAFVGVREHPRREIIMANEKGPNIKKKQKCKVHCYSMNSTIYQTPFTNFVLMLFHAVSGKSRFTCSGIASGRF